MTYTLAYDEENRIESVKLPVQADITTEQIWTFEYDGNGTRIRQGNPDGSQLLLLNGGRYHVEIAADTSVSTTRYYSIAGQRPAMRNNDGSINYLLGDHLGSVSTVVDASGQIISQSRYLPFGEVLWEDGSSPTDYSYTGQRSLSNIGLMDYNARFYDPLLGRFTSPDSIVPEPGSVIGYNRFAYVNNNPVNHNDPTGHYIPFDACMATNMNYGSCGTVYGPKITSGSEWGSHGIGTIGLQEPVVPGDENRIEGYYSPGEYKGSTFYEFNDTGYMWYEESDLSEVYKMITIHHEGDDQTYDVLKVQENEMDSGFYDIGYHYIIGPDGTIYEGRDIRARGNHARPNTGNIGILLLGDFNPGYDISDPYGRHGLEDIDDVPTQAQIYSAITLVSWLNSEYGINELKGHREIEGQNTACPGDNAMELVNLLRGLLP